MTLPTFTPQLLINGTWVLASGGIGNRVTNPATGGLIAEYRAPSTEQVLAAVDSAVAAFRIWRVTPAYERGRLMREAARLMRERIEQIALVLTVEEGKPLAESRAELLASIEMFEWFADEGLRAYGRIIPPRAANLRQHVTKEPVGVVAALCAWNFPARNPGYKIAAALAAGCTCIVKPAEETPFTCLALARAITDAGVPAGVLNVLYGDAPWLSTQLLAHPQVRKVSFTGSTRVGKLLSKQAADSVKKLTMELGGHAPTIVFEDADIDAAVSLTAAAKLRNAGQVCISPTRFFVHEAIHDTFVEKLRKVFQAQVVGDGTNATTTMGPLIHEARLQAVHTLVADAASQGATLSCGGNRRDHSGSFYEPTILTNVPDSARIMTEEPFGPVAPIITFRSFDEAIARANAVPYGLAAYVFTQSLRTASMASDQIESGMVGVNTMRISYAETPFGGVKESGYGSEGGIEGLDAYLVTKSISISL